MYFYNPNISGCSGFQYLEVILQELRTGIASFSLVIDRVVPEIFQCQIRAKLKLVVVERVDLNSCS
jgi:hypothetical protein